MAKSIIILIIVLAFLSCSSRKSEKVKDIKIRTVTISRLTVAGPEFYIVLDSDASGIKHRVEKNGTELYLYFDEPTFFMTEKGLPIHSNFLCTNLTLWVDSVKESNFIKITFSKSHTCLDVTTLENGIGFVFKDELEDIILEKNYPDFEAKFAKHKNKADFEKKVHVLLNKCRSLRGEVSGRIFRYEGTGYNKRLSSSVKSINEFSKTINVILLHQLSEIEKAHKIFPVVNNMRLECLSFLKKCQKIEIDLKINPTIPMYVPKEDIPKKKIKDNKKDPDKPVPAKSSGSSRGVPT